MLKVTNLHKRFGNIHAVRGVSFDVKKGTVLGFLGPNGAGKTTTMRMITGFLPPTSGTAQIAGYDVISQPVQAKRQLGYLPENSPAYGDMTVQNYLGFIAEIRGFTGQERRAKVNATLERCFLGPVSRQTIGTLSKGYRQRVGFAQAVLHDPAVLIMDEPTDGLDPNQKQVVRDMIREMAEDKVIVLSTHILEEVEAVCERVIIVCQGGLVFNGTPQELKARSDQHGAVEFVLNGDTAEVRGELEKLKSVQRVEVDQNRFLVYPSQKNVLMADVLKLLRTKAAWEVTSINALDGRLDEVFHDLTMQTARS